MLADPSSPSPYEAFKHRDFRLLLGGGLLAFIGTAMQSVAVGWEIYVRTDSAMALGWVGLVQALPIILLSIPAGHVADHFDRKWVIVISRLITALSSAGLMFLSMHQGSIHMMYVCLLIGASAQAFNGASSSALLPQVVPRDTFNNAVTWKSSTFQLASVAGPALGGLLLAHASAAVVFAADAGLNLIYAFAVSAIANRPREKDALADTNLKALLAGFRFVWRSKTILAAITLDLFAVLFGGATALMPIFARDILHVGPAGLGWLRAAPAIGAFGMAIALAHLPPLSHAGRSMLWSVIGFGLTMIVFGLSPWFWLSMLMLALSGALDLISVVVRHNLVQLGTPDEMRGRVSAVNNVFISSSNELGAFESGLVAAWIGVLPCVVVGGFCTILVVFAIQRIWPQIAALKSLSDIKPISLEAA